MKSAVEKKAKTTWDIIIAPTQVLKVEKFYWFWIVSYLFSFIGILIDLFNGEISNGFQNGMIYNTCIAVILPLFIDFLSNYVSGNKQRTKEEFSAYKVWVMGLCLAMLVLLSLLYGTKMKSSLSAQIICFVLVFLLSFYTYLVTKMSCHSALMADYKDKPYYDVENEIITDTNKKSKKLKKTTIADGTEVKL